MTARKVIELDKAIEEAVQFGFTKQFILLDGQIKNLVSNKNYLKEEFAIVKRYPINSAKGYEGTISYVVSNDCTLGYFLKERKKNLRKLLAVEKHSHFEI